MFPLGGNARIGRFSDGEKPPKLWYFIDDGARNGHGYFVGYDSQSKLCAGFIGLHGLRPDRPPAEEWFPMDGVKLADNMAFARHAMGPYWSNYGYGASLTSFPRGKWTCSPGPNSWRSTCGPDRSPRWWSRPTCLPWESWKRHRNRRPPMRSRLSSIAVSTWRCGQRIGSSSSTRRGSNPLRFSFPKNFATEASASTNLSGGRALVATGRTLPGHSSPRGTCQDRCLGEYRVAGRGHIGQRQPALR